MNNFVETFQKRANYEMQDRICYDFIQTINGYAFTVLDGHGSKQCADFVHKTINNCIKERFKQNQKLKLSLKKYIEKSLNEVFQDMQSQWFKIHKKHMYEQSFNRSGACCLTAIVLQNSIHIANAGDCQGVILGKHEPIKTNKRLNANEPYEEERLKRQFPKDRDIIVERSKRTNKCNYVKGELQPTKAIGDFQLKDRNQFFGDKENFNGPYIDYRPQFSHFRIKSGSEYLVLATDGMWDQLNASEVDKIIEMHKENIAETLCSVCIKKVEKRNKITESQLQKTPLRRIFHDDISIIVVDLKQLKANLSEGHK